MVPLGWRFGRNRDNFKKENGTTYGTKWINNGSKNRLIKKEEEVPNDWRLGKLQKHK